MSQTTLIKTLVAAGLSLSWMQASAMPIEVGTYQVLDHPDGGMRPPLYCLRLDGLLNGRSSSEYTFSCDDNDASVTLEYDGNDITIAGRIYGGEDIGSSWRAPNYWNVEFTYEDVNSRADGGYDDLVADAGNYENLGRIWNDDYSFELTDFGMGPNMHDYTFRLGDRGGNGHRGYNGISGWGWVNYFTPGSDPEASEHMYASDFLFTVVKVPEPGSLLLIGTGFLGLALNRRRRR